MCAWDFTVSQARAVRFCVKTHEITRDSRSNSARNSLSPGQTSGNLIAIALESGWVERLSFQRVNLPTGLLLLVGAKCGK